MRYMFLIYSVEAADADPEALQAVAQRHRRVMDEAAGRGVLEAAEPLKPTVTATTLRLKDGDATLLDGPFAETKEQLAGYYILNCQDLDDAIEWAKKIPTGCKGGEGCIEIRPLLDRMQH
jgi:hypothetical protein